ncbi:MAG: hypothetical protein Tsb0019_24790 [Roseibium sp.]
MSGIELGLGLVSLGRSWGVRKTVPPARPDAIALIQGAYDLGIRFFDVAPAYNTSEAILGEALGNRREMTDDVVIATKAGEHWVGGDEVTRVDHSFDALCRSMEQSLERLGRIDLMQIHKATEECLRLADLERFISRAREDGIGEFGASVSSETAALAAIDTGLFGWLQFPVNTETPLWRDVTGRLKDEGMRVLANRPFAMGAAAERGAPGREAAFVHVLSSGLPEGSVVLTGTRSMAHLRENVDSYAKARA